MSDLNQTTEVQATAEAKGPVVPTTAKHARFLAAAARKRSEKLFAQVADADKLAAHYDELAAQLPESTPSAPKAAVTYEVGVTVTFRYGRNTPTSKAKEVTGVIRARKEVDGKIEAYRVVEGEGFDETLYTVQPGQIIVPKAEGEDGAEQAGE